MNYSLYNTFLSLYYNDFDKVPVQEYGINLNDNICYQRFLQVDLTKDYIDIPVFGKDLVESLMVEKLTYNKKVKALEIPLFCRSTIVKNMKSEKILESFFKRSFSDRLLKIVTLTGKTYYGGKGILLDSNYNIVLLAVVRGTWKLNDTKGINYKQYIVKLSPDLFSEKKDALYRYIVNKVMPSYIGHEVNTDYYNRGINKLSLESNKIIFTIESDLNRYIVKPKVPNINTTNEDYNQVLLDNIEDIKFLL
jgi:hypothetical protein